MIRPYNENGADQVPVGWVPSRLGDLVSLRGGVSYKAKFISEVGVPLITMGCVSATERFNHAGVRSYTGPFTEACRLRDGDIVIATRDVTQNRLL